MAIYKIQASRVNNITATEFTGQDNELGQIWYDQVDGILRLYDGNPGGKIINGGGTANASQLVNGNSNVVVYPNGNVAISVNGTSNVMVFSNPNAFTGNIVATGNVSAANILADNYFYGNGAPFAPDSNYSNANVASFLSDLQSNAITTTANVSAGYFLGNGAFLTGINSSNYSNANVAAYLPINTVDIGANNLVAAGNVTGSYFIGNGALLTGVVTDYGNANVAAYLPTNTSDVAANAIIAAGNITGNYFIGNGALLTGVVTDYGNSNVAAFLGNLGSNAVTTTANVTADYFIGNGALLSGIAGTYSNANVESFLPTYSGNLNPGTISATGNITGDYFIGNGSQLTGITTDYSNANVVSLLADLGANSLSTTGNIAADYFVGNGSQLTGIVATEIGNLTTLTVTGNITAGNLQTLGAVSALGNVAATYFLGNGAFLTGITAGNGVPSQTGQAGKFLTTDGSTASWNDALGASLTFNGGASYADQATELEGGTAASMADNAIDGGGAASDFSLTLSPVALTGQYEDLVDLDTAIPAAPTSAGAKGQIAFDTNFIYLCVAQNVWRRATLASWS